MILFRMTKCHLGRLGDLSHDGITDACAARVGSHLHRSTCTQDHPRAINGSHSYSGVLVSLQLLKEEVEKEDGTYDGQQRHANNKRQRGSCSNSPREDPLPESFRYVFSFDIRFH